jgi:hypothetical protein
LTFHLLGDQEVSKILPIQILWRLKNARDGIDHINGRDLHFAVNLANVGIDADVSQLMLISNLHKLSLEVISD